MEVAGRGQPARRKLGEYEMKKVGFVALVVLSALLGVIISPTDAAASLAVDYAYLRSAALEYDCGTIHVYLKNPGETEVSIEQVWVNDVLMKDLPNDLAVWYQVLPNPVLPHKVADVMVRLAEQTAPPFNVRIETSEGQTITESIEITIPPPPLRITYIGFSDNLDRVYVYLENTEDRSLSVDRVYLDTENITSLTTIPWRTLLPHRKDCIIANLERPLTQGEYISIKVTTKQGPMAQAVVRVLSFFPITSWDGDTRAELHFDSVPLKINYPADPAQFEETRKLGTQRAYYLFSDPSCTDKRNKAVLGTSAMEIIRRLQTCYEHDPLHPGFTHICEYRKKHGYFVYGEVWDLVFINPYQLVFYGKSPRENRYFARLGKKGCEPRPLMVIQEAFSDEEEISGSRFPTPEEERLIVYYEIAEGAKGVNYLVKHYGDNGGYDANPELEAEIGRINWELRQLKPYLKIGDPVAIAETNEPEVTANTILCGDKAIVLILINEDYDSPSRGSSEQFEYRPKQDFEVTVHLPDWLQALEAYEVVGELEKSIPVHYEYTRIGDIIISVDQLDITKQIVITTQQR